MKEKIRQLAKEQFTYQLPNILLSEENIQITVEAGKAYMGSFIVSNDEDQGMKGVIYCNTPNMRITNPMFIGKQNEIQFVYDAKQRRTFEDHELPKLIHGKFHIVSNCGEVSLNFQISIEQPFAKTSLGEIKDLFHFTNLAHSDWKEAAQLFQSEDFERVFLKKPEQMCLYKSLVHGGNIDVALEEFLISSQKKLPINIAVDRLSCEYKNCLTDFMDKIVITKDNWGYEMFQVSSEAPFLIIQRKEFSTFDFCGNSYDLEFLIAKEKLRNGMNYGEIQIKTTKGVQTISIAVSASDKPEKVRLHRRKQELMLNLTQNYLNLRTNQIAHDKYIADLAEVLKNSDGMLGEWGQKLLELHYYIMDHQSVAEDAIKAIYVASDKLQADSIIYYCAYLYLRALYTKKGEDISGAVSTIRAYYEEEPEEWRFLWFLLYLDESYDQNPEKKWQDIAECIDRGIHSPVMYYEACLCLEADHASKAYFIKSLGRILRWGVGMKCLSQDYIDLFCFLAQQEEKASAYILNTLFEIYEDAKSKEVLFTICQLLIQNNKKEPIYFRWFDEGQEAQLKLENLFEYYIETMEESYSIRIPNNLLMFFQYDNQLNDEKKAFLYAYIIKNKHRDMGTFMSYDKIIEKFAIEQIRKEKMNRHLAVIYEEYIDPESIDGHLATALGQIMFCHEIKCKNLNMTGIVVSHKELDKEIYTPLVDGSCFVDIYTENPSVVFCDEMGNRFSGSIEYENIPLLHISGLAEKCYEHCKTNNMVMLSLFEKSDKYQKCDTTYIYVQRRCVLLPGFIDYYKGRCYERLIQHYFDSMETEALVEVLKIAEFSLMSEAFRSKAIYYCMIYDLEEKACQGMIEYGFDNIPINRMIRFCTEEIKKNGFEQKNKFILSMAYHIVSDEKYNETILHYLLLNYEGELDALLKLWHRCMNFELDTYVLEERILSQVLFSENQAMRVFDIFESYFGKNGDETLIQAFISYGCYKYLLNERIVPEKMFEIIESNQYFKKSEVSLLALLLYYSKQEQLTKEQLALCETKIQSLVKKETILPFFQQFRGKVKLPQELQNYYYVEYTCNPKNQVTIHYALEDEESQSNFKTAVMKNSYYGIHVMRFFLFHDETLKYYISENDGTKEQITESVSIDMKGLIDGEEESNFGLLNLILTAKDLKDEKTMFEAMEYYVERNYAANKLIKIL